MAKGKRKSISVESEAQASWDKCRFLTSSVLALAALQGFEPLDLILLVAMLKYRVAAMLVHTPREKTYKMVEEFLLCIKQEHEGGGESAGSNAGAGGGDEADGGQKQEVRH